MRRIFSSLFLITLFSIVAHAQIANHLVISEVFYLGATGANEFVEIYNPTGADIALSGIVLQSGTAGTPGSNSGEWNVDLSSRTIKSHGFLLVGGSSVVPTPDFAIPSGKDLKNSATRSGVRLYNTATSSVIDGVAWDATAAIGLEGAAFTAAGVTSSNPKSIERKARSSSTTASMSADDAALGNGYDTNDNSMDFVLRDVPQPQNSTGATEGPSTGPDLIPPGIFSVKTPSPTQVDITFNEAVDSLSASTPTNYTMDNGVTINQAARNVANPSKVSLTVSTMTNGVYTLGVQNVKDTSGNAIVTPLSIQFCYGYVPVSQARGLGVGAAIRVRGIITVGSEFGGPPSYLQDSTGGIAVFNYNFSASAKAGDIWEVAGTIKDFNGLFEIDPLTDSVKISSGNPLPKPRLLTSGGMNESVESQLARVNKVLFANTGYFGNADSSYAAADPFGPITVLISKSSNIVNAPIPTDSVNIVGVVNERNGVYRLLPRTLADINVIDPSPGQTWMNIVTARNFPDGSSITIRGIVTFAQPSASAARTVYIQDATGGIAAYHPATDTLLAGDSVQVSGKLSTYNNFLEINPVDSLSLFARGLSLPLPKPITIPTASESYESQLVTLHEVRFVETGTFDDGTSGANYHVTDGSSQLVVRIPKNSLLTTTSIPVGAVDAVGVLAQFGTAYQLTPRSPSDLVALPGPQIVGPPIVTALSGSGFTVTWSTLLNGNSVLAYGATPSLGDTIVDQTMGTTHTVNLSGLASGRVYYFKVSSADGSGTSVSNLTPVVTTSPASSGEMDVYFNYSTDATLGLLPVANADTSLMDKLLNRISKATRAIDLALYSFDDFVGNDAVVANRVADSLVAAKGRGVSVRMVFDDKPTSTPLTKMIAAGISVIKRSVPGNTGIMHNKFFVFDGRDTTSATDDWVITGSWNVTNDGTVKDAQNALFIQDQSLARIYELEFEEMFGSATDIGNTSVARFGPLKQNNTPHFTYVGGKQVEVYFSPSDQTTSHIISALSTADQNVFFGLLSFTRTDIAGTLTARKNAGVIVRGIIDQQPSTLSVLYGAGIDVLEAGHLVVKGLFHHKYAVVDPFNDNSDPIVITGSHNWSSAAENDNDENTLIIHSGEIARQYVQEFSKRYQESGGTGPVLGVERTSVVIPKTPSLSQNYPNPFNPSTNIEMRVAQPGFVSLKIFDLLGREVVTLVNENKMPGIYTVTWDASKLASGMYLCRMNAEKFTETKKLLFVR